MKTLILCVSNKWLYNLYSEYAINISLFLTEYLKIENDLYFHNIDDINNLNNFEIDKNKYDTIIYFANINYFNTKVYNNFKNIYYVNFEPLARKSFMDVLLRLPKNTHILDYIEENIPLCNRNHFPKINLLFPYVANINVNISDKNIDVLTISNCPYRVKFIDEIDKINEINNIKCMRIKNCFGKERDELFKKAKIYINIHSNEENKTMESIRVNNLIINKVIVLSHPVNDIELYYFNKYVIICNNADEFKTQIDKILNNYEEFYNNFFKDFSYDNYIEYIKQNLINGIDSFSSNDEEILV